MTDDFAATGRGPLISPGELAADLDRFTVLDVRYRMGGPPGRDDYLAGRKGYDVLTGGKGYDTFVFEKGKDVITDFEHGKDKIVIAGYDWIDGYRDIKDRIEDHGDYATLDLGKHELKVEDVSWLKASDFDWI